MLMEWEEVVEVEEATLGEVAGMKRATLAEEGEDLTMLQSIMLIDAVIKQLDMVR